MFNKMIMPLFAVLMIVSKTSLAAGIEDVSSDNFVQYGKEDAYWAVTVTCNDKSKHVVQRKTDAESWCPKNDSSVCNEDKTVAFEYVCSDAYLAKIEQAKPKPVVAKVQPAQPTSPSITSAQEKAAVEQKIRAAEQKIQELIIIQDSIASINQELSKLNNEELELKRRITEIDVILTTVGSEEDEDI